MGGTSSPSSSGMSGTPPLESPTTPPPQWSLRSGSNDYEGKTKTRTGSRRRLPSPRELIDHYESQGMDTQQASLKVIEDLQKVLFRVVTSNNNKKGVAEGDSDVVVNNKRLLMKLENKLDSKPGYAETLAIGVASGAVVGVFPQIASAFVHIWNSVRSATSSSSSSINHP